MSLRTTASFRYFGARRRGPKPMRPWYFSRTSDLRSATADVPPVAHSESSKTCRARGCTLLLPNVYTNKHDKRKKSFVNYLEPSIRRGEEVYVIMENVGQFLSFTLTSPYWRPYRSHTGISGARDYPIFPYWGPLTTDRQRNSLFTKSQIENCCFQG